MRQSKKYYVYEWYVAETEQVFYVGKGSGDRCKRVSKYARSKDFLDIYHSVPCEYRIVEDNLTDDEACSIEIERIALHRNEENSILTNKTNGGEKASKQNRVYTEEYRKKISDAVRGEKNPNYGNRWSAKQRKHLSDYCISSGRYRGKENPNAKAVYCLETGQRFDTINDAASFINRTASNVSTALAHPQRTAGGFHWRYADHTDSH